MPEITLNGPVIRSGVHNVVLKDAVFHSPIALGRSVNDYNVIKVGVREGAYTTWIGTWDQSNQKVDAATPLSILDSNRKGMRLKENQAIVVNVSSFGGPSTLDGSRLNFRMAQVGGRYGSALPLVSGGTRVADTDTRSALAAIERNINGRLSEWEESVQLRDAAFSIVHGTFQGRLQVDSSTQISLQRYVGNWIEVDGEAVSLGSFGYSLTTSDAIIDSSGVVGSTAPSSSTLYGVYIGNGTLRLGSSTPSRVNGVYYLGTDIIKNKWRFCGWAYLNASTLFKDSDTERHLANYYNRLRKRVYTCPDYVDDNASSTYAESSISWAKVNAGSGCDISYIANGEDCIHLNLHMRATPSGAIQFGCAISMDGITDIEGAAEASVTSANERVHLTCSRMHAPSTSGQHVASFVAVVSAGSITVVADDTRRGATADPAESYMTGHLFV